jgi:hypothetical protein
MKWILLLSSLILCAITAHASDYDDCVLKGMKGVSSDVAARLVAEACRNKVDEARRAKRASFGAALDESEYQFGNNSTERHDGGYISQTLQNKSLSKTLTGIMLTVKDGDYYDYKKVGLDLDKLRAMIDPAKGIPPPMPDDPKLKWESERTHTYCYMLTLKPGKKIKLMFPTPRTNSFYSEIDTALGREAKWTDAVSTISLRDTIKPVPCNPSE